MKRSSTIILQKIREYATEINEFVGTETEENFIAERKTARAVTMNLLQIGELASHLSPEFKQQHAHIDWSGVIGLRHRLVHDYEVTNYTAIWKIITFHLPRLLDEITAILGKEGS